jgi:heme oxygenase (mycobilin-producing)
MSKNQPVFRVLLRMQIRPGLEQAFEQTWYQIGQVVTGHPANICQWLAKSQDEEGVYYITSDWTDEPRFREFEHSADHLAHRTRLHPFRSGGSMTTMHVVYAMAGTAEEGLAGGRAAS